MMREMSHSSDNKVEEVHLNTVLSSVGGGSTLCDNPIVRRQMPEDKPKEERHTEITEEDYENMDKNIYIMMKKVS